jgi:hypothetical protein
VLQALVLVLCLCLVTPGWAATVTRRLSVVELFRVADQARTNGRRADAEAVYNALAHDPNPEVRAEARFRHGMMLASLKRYREAAVLFRAILDEKPAATRVRLELARMLASMGDELAARRQLRQARAQGLPAHVALAVDQFDNALRSAKPFGGSFELALAPDTNINRATADRTLDTVIAPLTLSSEARQRSGIGVEAGGQAYARVSLLPDLDLTPRVSGQGNLYGASEFNDLSASATLGLEWRHGADRISPSGGATWRWYGGPLYAQTAQVSLDWIHRLGGDAQIEGRASAAKATYETNTLQNGWLYAGAASYERALSAKSGASLTLDVLRRTADDPGYATWSGGLTVLYWRELGRTTLFASAGAQRLAGDQRLFLFPEPRREWLYKAEAGATFRRFAWKGFAPIVKFNFEQNRSTVGLYRYRRFVTMVGIVGVL